jgi:hypothetical protein
LIDGTNGSIGGVDYETEHGVLMMLGFGFFIIFGTMYGRYFRSTTKLWVYVRVEAGEQGGAGAGRSKSQREGIERRGSRLEQRGKRGSKEGNERRERREQGGRKEGSGSQG